MNTTTKTTEAARKVDNPLTEMREWLAESIERCRSQRWFGPLFRFNVANDILADACAFVVGIGRKTYMAEQKAREVARLIEEAQRPDSPGGTSITPEEIKPGKAMLRNTAELLHDVAEAAAA
jgi:hypothetical protein